MYINRLINSPAAAYTLPEAIVGFALSCIVLTGILSAFLFCSSSLYALSNYASLGKASQNAVDNLSREIREMSTLSNYNYISYTNASYPLYSTITNSLTFVPVSAASTNSWITYLYDPSAQTLTRWQGGVSNVLLTRCIFLNFSLFQRNQSNGMFVPIPTSSPAQTKLVEMDWQCQDTSAIAATQSQCLSAAKVVIRAK